MRGIWRVSTVLVLISLGLAFAFSCCKGPTESKPNEYLLYISVIQESGPSKIFVIDTEADSIIDDVVDVPAAAGIARVEASPDGKYLAALSQSTLIYSAYNYALLKDLAYQVWPVFLPNIGQMLAFNESGVKFYNLGTFELLSDDTVGMAEPQANNNRRLIFGKKLHGEGHTDSMTFVAYDYMQRRLSKTWPLLRNPDGRAIYVLFWSCVNAAGTRLYGVGGGENIMGDVGMWFFAYDLWADTLVFCKPSGGTYRASALSPDGREVYLVDCGDPMWETNPGRIFVHDAENGQVLHEISLEGLDTVTHPQGLPRALYPSNSCFHPEKPKIYIACGGRGMRAGPVLVIDTEKREIIKWLFPNFDHGPQSIAIAPKP